MSRKGISHTPVGPGSLQQYTTRFSRIISDIELQLKRSLGRYNQGARQRIPLGRGRHPRITLPTRVPPWVIPHHFRQIPSGFSRTKPSTSAQRQRIASIVPGNRRSDKAPAAPSWTAVPYRDISAIMDQRDRASPLEDRPYDPASPSMDPPSPASTEPMAEEEPFSPPPPPPPPRPQPQRPDFHYLGHIPGLYNAPPRSPAYPPRRANPAPLVRSVPHHGDTRFVIDHNVLQQRIDTQRNIQQFAQDNRPNYPGRATAGPSRGSDSDEPTTWTVPPYARTTEEERDGTIPRSLTADQIAHGYSLQPSNPIGRHRPQRRKKKVTTVKKKTRRIQVTVNIALPSSEDDDADQGASAPRPRHATPNLTASEDITDISTDEDVPELE